MIESGYTIGDKDWLPVPVSAEGGDFRLPRLRAFSPGGYHVVSNQLYVGIPGARQGDPDGHWMGITGSSVESSGPHGTKSLRYHIFNVGLHPTAFAVDLPKGEGGEVTVDFTPALETRIVAKDVTRHRAGHRCGSERSRLSLHAGETARFQYEVSYESPVQGKLPLPTPLPDTEIFLYQSVSPFAWVDRKTLADMRGHALQDEGYDLTHDRSRREFTITRVGEMMPLIYSEHLLLLVLYTPNPVGDYSGVDCLWVDAAEEAK